MNDLVDEEPPSQAIKKMSLGEVKPQEPQVEDEEQDQVSEIIFNIDPSASSTRVEPPSSSQDQVQDHGDDHDHGNDQGGVQGDETQGDKSHNEEDDDGPIQRQSTFPHPRVHQSVQRDHPVDNILGSIQRG